MTDQNTFLGTEQTALIPPTSEERTMAILSHILCIFVWFIGPLVIYLIKKDESTFVSSHAKESLNFQLTLLIGWMVVCILIWFVIGIPLAIFLWIANIVLVIMATIKASEGKLYKYPFSIKFVK